MLIKCKKIQDQSASHLYITTYRETRTAEERINYRQGIAYHHIIMLALSLKFPKV